jgi:hypothetical protein
MSRPLTQSPCRCLATCAQQNAAGDGGHNAVAGGLRVASRRPRLMPDAKTMQGRLEPLHSQRPTDSPASVTHGDLHAFNILVEGERVTAGLDWELARVTDAEFDFARTKLILDSVPGMSSALLRPPCRGRVPKGPIDIAGGPTRIGCAGGRPPIAQDRLRSSRAPHHRAILCWRSRGGDLGST